MKWFNRYNFPYSNFHDLNLDWILSEMTRIREEWEGIKEEWEQMKIDWEAFQAEMRRLWQEYQDLMNAAWAEYQVDLNQQWTTYQNTLNTAWTNYQNALNAWKNGVDDEIDDLQTAWATYQTTVNNTLNEMETQIDNFISEMETYITNQLPSIAEPLISDWLDDIDPASLVLGDLPIITPEMFGAVGDGTTDDGQALVDCFQQANASGAAVIFAPAKNYVCNRTLYLDSGVGGFKCKLILGNGARITGTGTVHVAGPKNGMEIIDLSCTNLAIASQNTVSNLRIKGGTFSNILVGTTTNYANDVTFDGIYVFSQFRIYGPHTSQDQQHITVVNSNFDTTGNTTVEIYGGSVVFDNCYFKSRVLVKNDSRSNNLIANCNVIFNNSSIPYDSYFGDNFITTAAVDLSGDFGVDSRISIGLSNHTLTVSNMGGFTVQQVSMTTL